MKSSASPPLLICLNLQRRHADRRSDVYVPRAPQVLPAILACIGWARRNNLELVHIHSSDQNNALTLPIRGCEPRPSEYLLQKTKRSFVSHPHFMKGPLRGRAALVVGFTSDSDCIAAAYEAQQNDFPIAFVSDAVSASARSRQAPHLVDAVVNAMLADMAALTASSDLLDHELRLSSEQDGLCFQNGRLKHARLKGTE